MHWWADAYQVTVDDWGQTDGERTAEFVEIIVNQSGGMVIVLNGADGEQMARVIEQVGDPKWRGRASIEG